MTITFGLTDELTNTALCALGSLIGALSATATACATGADADSDANPGV